MTRRSARMLAAAGPNVRQLSARRQATRTRLLDAAQRVFIARGVFAATVEEICDAAGFTRGAFYSNFTDKDAIIEAVLHREGDEILDTLAQLSTRAAGSCDDLPAVLAQYFSAQPLGRVHYLLHTELRLAAMRDPRAHAMFIELSTRQWQRTVEAVLAVLRRAGREPAVPAEDLIDVLYGVVERSAVRSLIDGDDDGDALARRTLPAILEALTRPVEGSPPDVSP